MEQTHFRKAFNSPYLSSADITGDTILTVQKVLLEPDKTKKTKDNFNTMYFVENEIRKGEKLKPMILNSVNSKMVNSIIGNPYIENWKDIKIVVYVDHNVKMMGSIVEGLRLRPAAARKEITPDKKTMWANAKKAYIRDGDFNKVLERADLSEENQLKIVQECAK